MLGEEHEEGVVISNFEPHRSFPKELFAALFYRWRAKIAAFCIIFSFLFGGALIIYLFERNAAESQEDNRFHSYLNCVYFCTVTLATIGYGDITPKTDGGKIFVMVYVSIGLGANVYSIAIITKGFIDVADLTFDFIKRAIGTKRRQTKKTAVYEMNAIGALGDGAQQFYALEGFNSETFMKSLNKNRKLVIAFVCYIGLLAGGAAIFNILEVDDKGNSWGYLNSLYFCFVTLATIGYGDFHPTSETSKIFLICYVYVGLGFLAYSLGKIGRRLVVFVGEKKRGKPQKAPIDATPQMINIVGMTADVVLNNLRNQIDELDSEEREKIKVALKQLSLSK